MSNGLSETTQANLSPTLHHAFVQSLYAAAIDGLTRDLSPVLAAAPSFQPIGGPLEQPEQQPPPAGTAETSSPANGSAAAGSAPQAGTSCQQQGQRSGDTSPPHNVAGFSAAPDIAAAAEIPRGGQPYIGSADGNMLNVNQALADLLASSEDDDGDAAGGMTAAGAPGSSGLMQYLDRSRGAAAAGVPSQSASQPASHLHRRLPAEQLPASQDNPQHEARPAAEAPPVQQQQQQPAPTGAASPSPNPRHSSRATATPEPQNKQSSPGRKRVTGTSSADQRQQDPGGKRQRKGRPLPLPPLPAAATVPPPTPPSRAQAAAAVFALRCLHAVRDAFFLLRLLSDFKCGCCSAADMFPSGKQDAGGNKSR